MSKILNQLFIFCVFPGAVCSRFALAKRLCSPQPSNWNLCKILALKSILIVFREGLWRCFRSVFHLFCSALRELVLAYPLFPALPKLLACIFLLVLSWKKRATSLPEIFGDTFLLPNQFSLLSAGKWKHKKRIVQCVQKAMAKGINRLLGTRRSKSGKKTV